MIKKRIMVTCKGADSYLGQCLRLLALSMAQDGRFDYTVSVRAGLRVMGYEVGTHETAWGQCMNIEIEREEDGRWIAEIPELSGVMAYGEDKEEAVSKVTALALRVMADRLEQGEEIPELRGVFAVPV